MTFQDIEILEQQLFHLSVSLDKAGLKMVSKGGLFIFPCYGVDGYLDNRLAVYFEVVPNVEEKKEE